LTDNSDKLSQLTSQLVLELIYAEPGKDTGLLPINCLLGEIEELCTATPPPDPIPQVLTLGRQWVDAILYSNGLFDAASLKRLGEWGNWLESAWGAWERGQDLPELPATWQKELEAPSLTAPTVLATSEPVEPTEENSSIVLNLESDAELLREFASECNEHLQNIELSVLVLEGHSTDAETLGAIFRTFHTLKGGSGLLNLMPLHRLAHELESMLELVRQHRLSLTANIINLVLEGRDVFTQVITQIEGQLSGQEPHQPIHVPVQGLVERVRLVGRAALNPATTPPAPLESPAGQDGPALEAASLKPGVVPTDQPNQAPCPPTPTVPLKAESPETGVASGIGAACPALKVATQKLDTLIDLVGELVIAQSLVARDPALPLHPNARLFRNLAHLGRITNELQKTAMSMRMVPIRSTFQKMNRLVRDLAAKEGKQVELQVRGEDTELDRLLVENLNDPLVHMIRNAIDHGIEKPEVRLAQGKPAQGAISLSAWRQGGNMVIEVKDDGAGLNRDRIVAKALEQGLLQAKETLTDSEVFRLIFSPGFSTAEKVTEISGRGVGMDVVLRNVEAMRGNIEVQSRPGQGTSFCIHLPLTLAIINGLIVAVGEQRYILPVLSVRESFRPKAQLISTLNERGEIVNVRGRLSPLLRLYDYFNVTPRFTDPTQALVVVVGSEEENRCLLVDQLLGTQEIVIKSLGEPFKRNRALAGAAILGDGRVGLILDVDYLVKLDGQSRVQIAA
jgi:two-component system chemotaxis sensor kinase CheA